MTSGVEPPGRHELPDEVEAGLGAEDRALMRRCLTVMALLGVGSMAGGAASLYLVNHHPLLLVALSPIGRHLLLVAPTVDPVAFTLVAVTRRMAFYSASFFLGRALGPPAVLWVESKAPRFGRFIRWLERLFQRAPRTIVFLFPGPALSTIAGSSGMTFGMWAPLVTLGFTIRVVLVILFAEWLREPIESLLALIDEYWIPGTVLMATGIGLYQWRRRGRARRAAPGAEIPAPAPPGPGPPRPARG